MDKSLTLFRRITVLLFLHTLITQCIFAGVTHNTTDLSSLQLQTNTVLGLTDSTLFALPIIPDNFLTDRDNMISDQGIEIDNQEMESLLNRHVGILIPKGIDINPCDINNNLISHIKMSIIGKWVLSDACDSYLLKCVFDGGVFIYLISLKERMIIDSVLIAQTDSNWRNNEYIAFCEDGYSGSDLFSEKKGPSVFVFSYENGIRNDKWSYKLLPNGHIRH